MKILHLDRNHPLLLDMLTNAGFNNEENYKISKAETEKIISKYDGIVIRSRFNIDKDFLNAAKNLKFIARVGAGLESIDIDYAEKLGIKLIAAPEGNRNAVGEHALGMLLSLFNKLNKADKEVKNGLWNREANRGIELDGKTVGIIGYGNMGKAFSKKLSGFDCEVLCYDIQENVGDKNAKQVSLKELQQRVDVLSLHTPWTPLTNKMVNQEFINAFAKPIWFINTARGKSVVTAHLVAALKSGKILGAGLDVLEYEKLSFETLFDSDNLPASLNELFAMDNVILSPHIAGWTFESKEKLATVIAQKIIKTFKNNQNEK
ncbi:MAG: hydroxyacid dehydrogenase [Aequorivita sp.]|nr:hydroxyacid dehydrogenase [Aequorivita sp.]|tara:strand:- start:29909 stop:30865 length:957 start_codon:yes stop_codon:yes gene_type:complete